MHDWLKAGHHSLYKPKGDTIGKNFFFSTRGPNESVQLNCCSWKPFRMLLAYASVTALVLTKVFCTASTVLTSAIRLIVCLYDLFFLAAPEQAEEDRISRSRRRVRQGSLGRQQIVCRRRRRQQQQQEAAGHRGERAAASSLAAAEGNRRSTDGSERRSAAGKGSQRCRRRGRSSSSRREPQWATRAREPGRRRWRRRRSAQSRLVDCGEPHESLSQGTAAVRAPHDARDGRWVVWVDERSVDAGDCVAASVTDSASVFVLPNGF